ncbi:BRCT domain-containing protein [Marinomonas transparens]|uniref:BRCT domain-containing protein n=1 Tax=Marinomonas transparens TaxID=2795388 RepID=A0A934JTE8_9GAMM|nr:BRCT domain-containing protein [Marinomonas transparens]MBJ7536974.1 BRCT domain-containing protein [Marinomonas transparens]
MDTITPNYSLASNKKKAIYSLKGILQGIVADTVLNSLEALYLNTWLLDSKPLRDDPDVVDLLDAIQSALEDGKFTADELDDLNTLITDIIEYRSFSTVTVDDYVNEFLGLISGVVADDQINEKEFAYIVEWINNHADVMEEVAVKNVIANVIDFSKRDHVTQDDEDALLLCLKQTAGIRFLETGSADAHPMDNIADNIDSMDHTGARICFTGVFNTGSRKEVEAIANNLGAITRKDPSKSIDYVIIGTQVAPDWKHTSFGRKIQKAVELREGGHPLIILTEKMWLTLT